MRNLAIFVVLIGLVFAVTTRDSNFAVLVFAASLVAGFLIWQLKRFLPASNSVSTLFLPETNTAFAQNAPTGHNGEVLISYQTYRKLRNRVITGVTIIVVLTLCTYLGLRILPVPTAILLGPTVIFGALTVLISAGSLIRMLPSGKKWETVRGLLATDPRVAFAKYAPTENGGALKVGYTTYKRLYKAASATFMLLIVALIIGVGREAYLARQTAQQNFASTNDQLKKVADSLLSGQGDLREELKKLAAQSLQPAPTVDENSLTQRILNSVTENLPEPPEQIIREQTETKIIERTSVAENTLEAIQLEGNGKFVIKNNRGVTFVSFGEDSNITFESNSLFNIKGKWYIDNAEVLASAEQLNKTIRLANTFAGSEGSREIGIRAANFSNFTAGRDDLEAALDAIDDAFSNTSPVGGSYVVLSSNAALTGERVLTAGSGITLTDAGADSTITVSLGEFTVGTTDTNATAGSVLFAGANGVIQQDNANFFWDDTNNKLGIGWTTPQGKLSVYDPTSVTTFTGINRQGLWINGGTYTNSEYALISFSTSDQFAGNPVAQIGAKVTPSGSYLQFGTSSAYFAGITNTALTIDYLGKVGIGTTSPNEQLEISGNFRLPATTSSVGVIKQGSSNFIHSFGTSNFFAGVGAGNLTTTGTGLNTAVGASSGVALTTGSGNAIFGYSAGTAFTTGANNTSIGTNAGLAATTGNFNTLVGGGAGAAQITASSNSFIGYRAGRYQLGGSNTSLGFEALLGNSDSVSSTGTNNVAVGYQSGLAITSGTDNTFLGKSAGDSITTGINNIVIGSSADTGAATSQNTVSIGHNATAYTNAIALGYFSVAQADDVAIGTVAKTGSGAANVSIGRSAGLASTTAANNVFIGYQSGLSVTSGSGNTIVGSLAGTALTNQTNNSFFGYQAGRYQVGSTTGGNTGLGYLALRGNSDGTSTTGILNTAVGYSAGAVITSGQENTFLGTESGLSLTTGSSNTLLGNRAGRALTTGASNLFVGYGAGESVTTGGTTVYLGPFAGRLNTGIINTAVGYAALQGVSGQTTGQDNTAIGFSAASGATTASYGVYIGDSAGAAITAANYNNLIGFAAGRYSKGDANIALGFEALQGNSGGTSTGAGNIGIGHQALKVFTTGGQNTAIGYQSGLALTTASNNTLVGYGAGFAMTTGGSNTAVGWAAGDAVTTGIASVYLGYDADGAAATTEQVSIGYSAKGAGNYAVRIGSYTAGTGDYAVAIGRITKLADYSVAVGASALSGSSLTGTQNIAIGYQSGSAITSSSNNVLVGYNSGLALTSGGTNTLIGHSSGDNLTTGTDNTIIGYLADVSTAAGSYNTVVGSGATTSSSTSAVAIGYGANASGNTSVTVGASSTAAANGVAVGWGAAAAGSGTIAIGEQAAINATGTGLTTLGYRSLRGTASSSTGTNNTSIGYQSGFVVTTGSNNVLMGYQAALALTTGGTNTLIGGNVTNSLTTGSGNTALGYAAGFSLTTGSNNTFLGKNAAYYATTGNESVAIGFGALQGASGLSNFATNVAVGFNAGTATTSGSNNVLVGHSSGLAITSGGSNTLIGYAAGDAITTGTQNVIIGTSADGGAGISNNTVIGYNSVSSSSSGNDIAIGANSTVSGTGANIAIGASATAGTGTVANGIAIGYGSQAINSNTFVVGRGALSTTTGQIVFGGAHGGNDASFSDLYVGNGVTNSSKNATFTINATGGSGTNNAGAALALAGGKGTGSGAGGSVIIQTAPAGSSGASVGTLVERLAIDSTGTAVFNETGLATSDFRMEGDTDANLFFLDASADAIGVGTSSPSAKLHSFATTEQLRLGYDASNYTSFTVNSSGTLIMSRTGNQIATFTNGGSPIVNIAGSGFPSLQIAGGTALQSGNGDTSNLSIGSGYTSVTFGNSGNVGLGTASFGTSAVKVFAIANGTAPITSPADSIQLYAEDVSASSELKVRDEAGNITTLSPHNFSLFTPENHTEVAIPWSFYSRNDNVGQEINVDMYGAVETLQALTGTQFIFAKNTQTGEDLNTFATFTSIPKPLDDLLPTTTAFKNLDLQLKALIDRVAQLEARQGQVAGITTETTTSASPLNSAVTVEGTAVTFLDNVTLNKDMFLLGNFIADAINVANSLSVHGDTVFFGKTEFQNYATFSAKQAGSVTVPAGSTEATVTYAEAFNGTPEVFVTPKGFTPSFYAESTKTSFILRLAQPAETNIVFSWFAVPTQGEGQHTVTANDPAPVTPPVVAPKEPEQAAQPQVTEEQPTNPEAPVAQNEVPAAAPAEEVSPVTDASVGESVTNPAEEAPPAV